MCYYYYYYFNLRNILRWISLYSGLCWWCFLKKQCLHLLTAQAYSTASHCAPIVGTRITPAIQSVFLKENIEEEERIYSFCFESASVRCVFPCFSLPPSPVSFSPPVSTGDLWLHFRCFSACPTKFMTDGGMRRETEGQGDKGEERYWKGQIYKLQKKKKK